MFSSSKAGVCLFNKVGSNVLFDAFTESAKKFLESGKELIFTNIEVTFYINFLAKQLTSWSIL